MFCMRILQEGQFCPCGALQIPIVCSGSVVFEIVIPKTRPSMVGMWISSHVKSCQAWSNQSKDIERNIDVQTSPKGGRRAL